MQDEHTIVTLHNIDDEDFTFQYNASEGNPPYLISAGEVGRFPKFLAKHALKHLTDKILNKRGEKTDNQTRRLELANQIIVGEEKMTQTPKMSEDEMLRKRVADLNKESSLETILAKRKEEREHKEEVKKREDEGGKAEEETFEGLDEVEKPEPKPEPKPKPEKVVAKPTKLELFNYAEKDLKMVIDDKTRKKFNDMKVDELIKELNYPLDK